MPQFPARNATPYGDLDPTSLEALKGLQSNISNNPTSQLYLSQNQEKHGLVDSLAQAQRRQDPGAIAGLKTLLADVSGDIDDSPITQQGIQVDKQRGLLSDAINQGFGANSVNNPRGVDPIQAANMYHQGLEQEKVRQPVQIANINAQGGITQQQIQTLGLKDVQGMRSSGIQAGQDKFANLAKTLGAGADTPGMKSITFPGESGGGSISMQTQAQAKPVPPAVANKLATDRNLAERTKPGMWSFGGVTPEEQALKQDMSNFLMYHPASAETKQFIAGALTHPEYSRAPLEDILAKEGYHPSQDGGYAHSDGTVVTPQDLLEAQELLRDLRGF